MLREINTICGLVTQNNKLCTVATYIYTRNICIYTVHVIMPYSKSEKFLDVQIFSDDLFVSETRAQIFSQKEVIGQ